MSAHKTATVRVGEAEYQRLREAEEQLRLLELQKAQSLAAQERKQRQPFGVIDRESLRRNQEFSEIAQRIDQNIQEIELQAAKQIQTQVSMIQADVADYQKSFSQAAAQKVNQWIDAMNQQFEQNAHELQTYWQAQSIQQRLAQLHSVELENDNRKLLEAAYAWLEQLPAAYPNLVFFQNEFEEQKEAFNIVLDLHQNTNPESVCYPVHRLLVDLTKLRQQLEADLAITQGIRSLLFQGTNTLQRKLIEDRSVHAMDDSGQELPDEIDVDFWTEGAYQALVAEVDAWVQRLLANEADLSQEQWREELEIRLCQYEQRSIDLVTQARLRVLSSQLRFNIAQIVVDALETQGFQLQTAAYDSQDFRRGFSAAVRNFSGNEVVVYIDPDQVEMESGMVRIENRDAAALTEHELLQRNREIFSAIQSYGLEVSDIKAANLPPSDPTYKENLNAGFQQIQAKKSLFQPMKSNQK